MKIRLAESADIELLIQYDKHISRDEIGHAIQRGGIFIAEDNGQFAGWLRYGLFWDSIPFMNLLFILDGYRKKGFGRQLVSFWENEMKQYGYKVLMTSTQADEYAQHFYFKLGYEAIGGFRLDGDPYEVIFSKKLF